MAYEDRLEELQEWLPLEVAEKLAKIVSDTTMQRINSALSQVRHEAITGFARSVVRMPKKDRMVYIEKIAKQ